MKQVTFLSDGLSLAEGIKPSLPEEIRDQPKVHVKIVETLWTNTKPPIAIHVVRVLKTRD